MVTDYAVVAFAFIALFVLLTPRGTMPPEAGGGNVIQSPNPMDLLRGYFYTMLFGFALATIFWLYVFLPR